MKESSARRLALSLTTLIAVILTLAFVSPTANAAPSGSALVDSIVVDGPPTDLLRTTVTLNFDHGIRRNQAEQVKNSLRADLSAAASTQADYLSCEGSLTRSDSNGTFDVQYTCYSTYGTLAWGFRLSPAVQAIVVGNVSEQGLSWWRNGVAMPRNAPHTVPASYVFHGTMNPVYNGSHVDYQDYMTFRHNVGPGGTGSVTFAGGLDLVP